jgi:hypothetical protein
MKPTSKVVSVSTSQLQNYLITTVVCEDGSVWYLDHGCISAGWICILEAPTQPKSEIQLQSEWQPINPTYWRPLPKLPTLNNN